MRVAEVMTSPAVTIEPTEHLLSAFNKMKDLHIKHLPVVEDEQLIGIISDRDLLAHATRDKGALLFPRWTVEKVMTKAVFNCDANDDIDQAVQLMLTKNINCLPVITDKRVVGIITSRNILQQLRCSEGVDD